MKKLLTTAVSFALILCCHGLHAQKLNGFAFAGTTPRSTLKNHAYGQGGGLSFEHVHSKLSWHLGEVLEARMAYAIDLQCLGYSKKIEDVVMNTPNNDKGYVYFENTTFGFGIGPRFMLKTGTRFTPYAEVSAGARIFGTHRHNTLYDEKHENDLKEKDITIYSAVRPQVGVAGGFMLRICRKTFLDMRWCYTYGTGMKYVDLMQAWKDEDGTIRYRMNSSPTVNLLTFKVGLLFGKLQ